MSDFFYVPNFELRPMFSSKNLEPYDIFMEGKPKVLENLDMEKFKNYLEIRLVIENRDEKLNQIRFSTMMINCQPEYYRKFGIDILSAYKGAVLCPDKDKI